jgi:putative peptidoglycan lipid II flippase
VSDLEAARLVAVFYSAGIPLFCSVKILLPAFYARKEMKKPLAASVTAICVNIVLNLLLMGPLKQGGIALATVISSVVNNAMLFYFLRNDGLSLPWKELAISAGRAIAVSGIVSLVLYMVYTPMEKMLTAHRLLDGCGTIGLFAVFGGLYLLLARLTRAPEPVELLSVLKNRNKK